jgi:hypothetical protein
MTLPSVSRDVHFKIMDRCVAAKVTQVHDHDTDLSTSLEGGSVDLFVFPPPDLAVGNQARIREGDTNGTWHWPERV